MRLRKCSPGITDKKLACRWLGGPASGVRIEIRDESRSTRDMGVAATEAKSAMMAFETRQEVWPD